MFVKGLYTMIHKKVRFQVRPEKVDFVRKSIQEFIKEVKANESGTLVYESFQIKNDLTFLHIMTFKDETAEKFHKTIPHPKKFIESLQPNCEVVHESPYLYLIGSNRR